MFRPDPAVLEIEDEALARQGVPILHRPLECFTKLYGAVPDGPERAALFGPVIEWYLENYGEAARWDGVLGRFPLVIKGTVYLGIARLVGKGTFVQDWREGVEGLPASVAESVTREEFRPIAERLTLGSNSYGHLSNLRIDHTFLGNLEAELVKRALYDLENSAVILKTTGDTQSSVVMAHQATEKFLKAALKKAGDPTDLKKFGHNLPKLIDALIDKSARYRWLKPPTGHLQTLSPNMELRYGMQPRTVEDAVSAIHASLHVCSAIAVMWQFDHARGSEHSSFVAGKFYRNDMWQTLYCKSVRDGIAVLTLFTSHPRTGSQMMDLQLDDVAVSALYLEITDPAEEAMLRGRFAAHLRNPGKRVSPDELGIKQMDGPEGGYLTAMISRKINRPDDQ